MTPVCFSCLSPPCPLHGDFQSQECQTSTLITFRAVDVSSGAPTAPLAASPPSHVSRSSEDRKLEALHADQGS